MKSYFRNFFLIFLTILLPVQVFAQINFSNGYWSTTFECSDWVHDYPSTLSCDGLQSGGNWCAGSGGVPCAGTDQSRGESILASANNPAGVPGTAAQVHYFFTGSNGQGATNDVSGGLLIKFPNVLQEYWFRYYIYYPEEMGWGGSYSGWKTLYFDHGPTAGWYFGAPRGPNSTGFYFQTSTVEVASTGYGDTWFEANGRQGFGRWVPVEIHQKNDTNGRDGIVRVWLDNNLVINKTDHNFAADGFRQILVGSNGDSAVAYNPSAINTVVGIRFDDMAIALSSYPGFVDDGNGYRRIGFLGGGDPVLGPSDQIIAPPTRLRLVQ